MADEIGLGQRIIRAREARGWSQIELARRARINRAQLNMIETGERANPGIQLVKRLARVLGVTLDYLGEMDRSEDLIATPHA